MKHGAQTNSGLKNSVGANLCAEMQTRVVLPEHTHATRGGMGGTSVLLYSVTHAGTRAKAWPVEFIQIGVKGGMVGTWPGARVGVVGLTLIRTRVL